MKTSRFSAIAIALIGIASQAHGQTQGFLYSNGSYANLSDPLATGPTSAYGINDAGQVVGSYFDGTGLHGFIYSNGTFTTLNNPLNPNNTVLYGVNNAGQIVGNYGNANGVMQGFLYNSGTFTTLSDPVSPFVTQAYGISNAGQITGNINISSTAYGFIYNGSYTTLSVPGSTCIGCGTIGNGINNTGQVVGYAAGLYPTYALQGFFYSNGAYSALSYSSATVMPYGINDQGLIVGQLLLSDNTSPGFLYSNGSYTLLNDPLSPSGDTRAYGINNFGQIVGNYAPGQSPVGVPGPVAGTGLSGLIAACAGLLAWRRRQKTA